MCVLLTTCSAFEAELVHDGDNKRVEDDEKEIRNDGCLSRSHLVGGDGYGWVANHNLWVRSWRDGGVVEESLVRALKRIG